MKNKIKNKFKKILFSLAAIMSILCGTNLPVNAASANVTAGPSTGYNINVVSADGMHTEWNENYQAILVDGEYGFCVDPGYVLNPGVFTPTPYNKEIISIITYEGWVKSSHTMSDYMATQFMIWEALGASITTTSFSAYGSYKSAIQNRINHHKDRPSFDGNSITLKVGESITLNDTNGVFSQYTLKSNGGLNVSKNGNSLTITGALNAPDNTTISYDKIPSNCVGTSVVYANPSSPQKVAKLYVSDPLRMNINVKVLKYGSLKLAKQTEEGTLVPNTSFKLSYNADMSNPLGTYKTGADGTVKIDELLPQTVYIQETSVPANLVLDPTVYAMTIVPNEVVTYTQTNNIQKGKITLKKVDVETGNKPQGEATLAGATYGLFARENIVDPITGTVLIAKNSKVVERITKADGSMDAIENLYLGEYYVQETAAPAGYILNPEKINISLTYAGLSQSAVVRDITSKESIINGDFQITKIYTDQSFETEISKPEKGAVFHAILKKYVTKYGSVEAAWQHRNEFNPREYDEMITKDDGVALSKKLAYGTYVIQQSKAGNEDATILKETFEAVIKDENQPTIHYVVNNKIFTSYLQIVKKDAESGKTVTLSKASFKIYDVDHKEYVSQRIGLQKIDTWTTDKDGKVTLPLELSAGNYRLEEIIAPNGYLINKEGVDFKIKQTHVSLVDEEKKPITIMEMRNEKPTGNAVLIKTDDDTRERLSGVQYQLTAAEDILDPADGKIIYAAGDPVSMDISKDGYYMSDELGEIHVAGLPLGSYTWKETKALDGYVMDTKEHTFTLTQKDNTTRVYTNKQELTNYILTKIQVNKVDSNTKEAIKSKDFMFTAYKDKDCKDAFKTVNANIKDGTVTFELRYGDWYIKETKAPQGYELSNEVKHIKIGKDGVFLDDIRLGSIEDTISFPFENEKKPQIKTGDNDEKGLYLLFLCGSTMMICLFMHKRKKI